MSAQHNGGMPPGERAVIYIILFVLTIAVVLLALTVQRASASTATRASVAVHHDALRVHSDRISVVWRAQDRINARLAALEHAADRAGDGR